MRACGRSMRDEYMCVSSSPLWRLTRDMIPSPSSSRKNSRVQEAKSPELQHGAPGKSTKEYLCVYVFIEYDHIITYNIYYIHTYIWTHTHKCMRTRAYTHTYTQNDRKDWNTRPRYKRAWHSGRSLEYVTWSSSLGRKVDAHQTSPSNPSKGKEWERDLEKGNGIGKGGREFPSPLTSGPLAKTNSHNLVLIRHSSIAGAGN